VIGFTDLLKRTSLTPIQQQYVSNANVSGHALLGIINDILDFSKIEAGMLNLEIIQTDMIELLENSVDIIKYAAGKKGLEVLLNIDSAMPRFAKADPIRLKQILANLLGNAVKFTDKGEVELKVRYESLTRAQGRLVFSVRDTGIGIAEAQKSKLFKAFSQADSSTTRKFGGTGLGLIISDMIAQQMGSKIQIESQQGEGSVFFFDLVTETEAGEQRDALTIPSIARCLIVDDNAGSRKILEGLLTGWKVETESCGDGLTAIKKLEGSRPFDVVICDYHMPDIDGLETVRMIREKMKLSEEKLPIILLHSFHDDMDIHQKCEELGVRFRLTKPVKSSDLISHLRMVHQPRQKPEPSATERVEPSPIATDACGSAKILIAEDVGMNMMMIQAMLSSIVPGAKLLEAANGLEAVENYTKEKPDLILMDVQMPQMDGVAATIEIRKYEQESGTHVPIIALTAGAFEEEREKCLTAGMDGFMSKPVEREKIREIVRQYLSRFCP